MTLPYCRKHLPALLFLFAALAATGLPFAAQAQSSCSSDGVPAPSSITERFFSADCTDCWAAKTDDADKTAAVLDWIVPSPAGDAAALSAAATRDAIYRLQALQMGSPTNSTSTHSTPVKRLAPYTLRVAMGQPVSGYMGTSIELKNLPPFAKRPQEEWTSTLVLVEALPAGAEGNTAPRFMVRNSQISTWNMREQLLKAEQIPGKKTAQHSSAVTTRQFFDSRPMGVPAGTQHGRLQLLGWVQDAQGRVVAAAQSRCVQ